MAPPSSSTLSPSAATKLAELQTPAAPPAVSKPALQSIASFERLSLPPDTHKSVVLHSDRQHS